jgi:DNA-binding transcriptional MerR regulator
MCDVAELAGISKSTVRWDVARGLLAPSALTPRGGRLFTKDTIDAYLIQRRDRQRLRVKRAK